MSMEPTLAQILDAREHRVQRQRQLLEGYGGTLICFTMNIPGPVKVDPWITAGFDLGCRLLEAQLAGCRVEILHREREAPPTGCQAFYAVAATPERIKALTVEIEESPPLGRLFDMDVLSADGSKQERAQPRKCLLCDRPARLCGPTRAHSVQALQAQTRLLLRQGVTEHRARSLGALACRALLWEVCTTPKPGLVDRCNSGSHSDMDIFAFTASAAALQPYFADCVRLGMETAGLEPRQTLGRLRRPGRLAEQEMANATGGVNTHKGAIFSLGLLCGAVGRLGPEGGSASAILEQCAAMAAGLTQREFAGVTAETAVTAGQRLYARYGITGIRGQAEAGFPAVARIGLPVLKQGLARGLTLNDAGCAALLHIMTDAEDTNLISRSDPAAHGALKTRLRDLLAAEPYPDRQTLEALDREFCRRKLSPGGSADLLALTYFLHFLETERT